MEEMYYIYAGHDPTYSFIKRPFEYIVNEIKSAIKNGKTTIVFSNSSESLDIHIKKIQRIADHFVEYSIEFLLLTGSVDGQYIYDSMFTTFKWKNKIKIVYLPIFEITASSQARTIPNINYQIKKKEKLFLSLNRSTSLHRFHLLNFVLDNNFLSKSFFSFEGVELERFLNTICLECKEHKNINTILEQVPIRLNITEQRSNPSDSKIEDKYYFDESYFSVVTETYFSTTLEYYECSHKFFSEKIFKPIIFKHPFILVGWVGALQELKKLGYKTFSPYIDEAYDLVEDDVQRMDMIQKEIIRLSNKTNDEWIIWQTNLKDVLEYNHMVLLSKVRT
jgi:hypothetical protein